MKALFGVTVAIALAVTATAAATDVPMPTGTPPAAAESPAADNANLTLLPADPSRALVVRTCVVCHPVELVASKKRTIETWDKLISKMVDYGAKADDAQQIEILTYFARYFEGTDTSSGAPAPATATTQK